MVLGAAFSAMISETDFCRIAPEATRVVIRSGLGIEGCGEVVDCASREGTSRISISVSAGGVGWSAVGDVRCWLMAWSALSRSMVGGSAATVVGVGNESTATS